MHPYECMVGAEGLEPTLVLGTGFGVQRVYQFRHAPILKKVPVSVVVYSRPPNAHRYS
jgi:hypothetical protein